MDHMDRKTRKPLPGITARRRKGGAGGAPECGGFSRVPRIHTVRVRIYVFLLSPPAPTTFLPERYYLSRSLQPPFSGNKHQYVIPSSGYLLSHRLHRFSFVLRTPNLTTTYTTYTTFNGDNVAKGRVVLVVHVVVNSKFVVVNSDLLSLTISVPIRVHPMPHKICEICAICVKKKTAELFGGSKIYAYLCNC